MDRRRIEAKLWEFAVFGVVLWVAVYCAFQWGVREKSLWEKFWIMLTGGAWGCILGIGFFLLFGAIGWVCGPLYGAIGVLGLAVGGGLTGLGLGALVQMVRNPQNYEIHWGVVIPTVLAGGILAKLLSGRLGAHLRSSTAPSKRS